MTSSSRHIAILGAGESGTGAALLCHKLGYNTFVSDGGVIRADYKDELSRAGIAFEEGRHSLDQILMAEEIVKSPGIAENSPVIKTIRSAGIPVISEIELAFRHAGDSKIIAITGSNGKTTTTALTYHIFKHAGLDAACVGNIGNSFARQIAICPAAYYVVEVSSFQLDDIRSFRPDIAVLLNITPDHLDRYDYTLEKYADSKFRITEYQKSTDVFIYCLDDPETMNFLPRHPIRAKTLPFSIHKPLKEGGYMENNEMHVRINDEEFSMSIYELALKGKHNLYNSMAAGIAARTMNIRKEQIRESLASFKSLEHRLEFVASIRGVDFINDSKATNINSLWFALESMEKPVILIMGGIDKGNDYSLISDLVKEKVKSIICLGLDNKAIHEGLANHVETIVDTSKMEDAVHAAFLMADKGDVVLLSPACASFDLFKNYEDRGRRFKNAVKEL